MMTKDEALKLALEALERSVATCFDQYAHQQVMSQPDHFINKAITAIKEALAQTQEPVGQLLEDAFGRGQVMWFNKPKDESMLYTTPPQRTWVGLTDEERQDIALEVSIDAVLITEAKLKEKNH